MMNMFRSPSTEIVGGCGCVWLCGCVAVWLWLCGCVAVWLRGCVWLCGKHTPSFTMLSAHAA